MRRIIGLVVAGALALGACGTDDTADAANDPEVSAPNEVETMTTTSARATTTYRTRAPSVSADHGYRLDRRLD